MLNSESLRRLFRFGLVGVAVMASFMALNWLFGRIWPAQVAFFAAYPPALLLHYLLNKRWTFGDQRTTTGRHVAEYLYAVTVTFVIQWPVFTLAVHALRCPAWLAAGIANVTQMTASFLLLQWRVFHPSRVQESAEAAGQRLAILLVGIGMAALLAWTALGKWEFPALGPDYSDHYNLLVHGFRKGSLAMDLPVPAAYRDVANPWDPTQRPPDLWVPPDTSYFNGHFYLYFGVVPAVVLMWPFRAIFGVDLPMVYALIIFCLGACAALGWLWLRVLRDHFPRSGGVTRVGGLLVLGLGGGLLMLARRAHFWELPIAAGQCCLAIFLVACYRALHATRPAAWLAMAGLSLGLAVGSRPNLAVAGVALGIVVITLGWRAGLEHGWRGAVRPVIVAGLAAGIPLAIIIAGLLAYNQARFGRMTEFGLNYQLTSRYEAAAVHFSPDFAGFNWKMYFWRMPRWERYFPFVRQAVMPTPPRDYYTCEFVFGALTLSPILWFGLLVPGIRAGLRAFGFALAAMAGAITVVLLCFNTAVARYSADFLPWWLLLALLGWATAEGWMERWPGWRRMVRALAGGLMLATILLSFCASAALHGVFRNRNPESFLALARLANRPVAWWEARIGQQWGPVEMDVVFPPHPARVREPLVVAAEEQAGQSLVVNYLRPGFVRLEFEDPTQPVARASGEIAVEAGHPYHLRFESGALYPPETHPLFAQWSPREAAWHAKWLRLEFDHRTIFDGPLAPWEISPAAVRIGRDFRAGREPRFTGELKDVRRAGLPRPLTDTSGSGDLVMQLGFFTGELPVGSPLVVPLLDRGRPQPLATAGRSGRSDLLAIRVNGADNTCVLAYESWGSGLFESPPVALPPGQAGEFRVRLGSILDLPANTPLDALRDTLAVWLDGRLVWWRRLVAPIGAQPPLYVAANPIGSNAATTLLRWRLADWNRLPAPAWRSGPFDDLHLVLVDRGTGAEPLVATGATGAANTLAIEWLPEGKARLLYDHWGYEARRSETFDWRPGTGHALDIELPAFARLDAPRTTPIQEGQLRIRLDDRLIWEDKVPFYVAAANTVAVGKNPAGASVAAPQLSSIILDMSQRRVTPAGLDMQSQPSSQ